MVKYVFCYVHEHKLKKQKEKLISLSYQILHVFLSCLMKKMYVRRNGWGKNLKDSVVLEEIVMKWIQQSKKDKRSFLYELDEFHIHLEYVRNGVTFRCHPNYKSNGE